MSQRRNSDFRQIVLKYYAASGRHDLPWRQAAVDGTYNPYAILVSEIMLQQTQVSRVIPKFNAFMKQFPDVHALATASLRDVLIAWQGLGYNRRAKYIWQAALIIESQWKGVMPRSQTELESLPGIGSNTAAAILAHAFNQPVVFIETNIRTVFIHHFIKTEAKVSDKALMPLVAATLNQTNPRQWYWALMDYGSFLKQQVGNSSRQSQAYVKQATFSGSLRQIRGQVLRLLTNGPLDSSTLLQTLADERASQVLRQLEAEHLVQRNSDVYDLP
jgi:A/G-specific adenine glycosylase